MNKWNYRVLRRAHDRQVSYQIYEVYYDEGGNVVSFSEDGMSPYGETPSELREEMNRYLEAFNHPILDYDKLESELLKGDKK